ncbi:hypothetical protein AB9Q29_005315 [Pantoea vagans]|uniref:hypothetical protein n=1 Tax=Pantoea vagans TaxID=470934 RepID=UPI0035129C87
MIMIVAFFIAYFLLSKTANLKNVLRIALPFGCYVIDFYKTSAALLSPLQKSKNKKATPKGGSNQLI